MAAQNIPVEPARFPKVDTSTPKRKAPSSGRRQGLFAVFYHWTVGGQARVTRRGVWWDDLEKNWVVKLAHKVNPRCVKPRPATTVTQRQLAATR